MNKLFKHLTSSSHNTSIPIEYPFTIILACDKKKSHKKSLFFASMGKNILVSKFIIIIILGKIINLVKF